VADLAVHDDGRTRTVVSELFRPPFGAAYVLVYDEGESRWAVEDSLGHVNPNAGRTGLGRLIPSPDGSIVTLVDAGKVAIRRRDPSSSQWVFEALLEGIAKPGKEGASFGSDVAGAWLPSGEELVFIGVQNGGDDEGAAREGSAYAFVRDPSTPPGPGAWTMEARLLAPDGEEGDRFGTAVALLPTSGLPGGHAGDALALVGADYHPRTDGQDGAVYTLTRDGATGTWTFAEKLTSSDLQDFDHFGAALALLPLPGGAPGEALALIGASQEDERAVQGGAAYAYRREADAAAPSGFRWVEEAKLLPERAGTGLAFGASVALALDTLAAGTPGETPVAVALVGADPDGDTGSFPSEAGLFVRTVDGSGAPVWTRRATYATGAEGPEAADWFGHAVALAPSPAGLLALVGAYYSNAAQEQGYPDAGLAAGAVFVYDGRATVSAEPEQPEAPAEAGGLTVHPNPAHGAAEVQFTLAVPTSVWVSAFDVLGREVAVLHEGPMAAGAHALRFEARGLAAGVYVLRLEGAGLHLARTVTVVR